MPWCFLVAWHAIFAKHFASQSALEISASTRLGRSTLSFSIFFLAQETEN